MATDKPTQKALQEEAFRKKHGPWETGDTVKLKSGGPLMTICDAPSERPTENVGPEDVLCMYFVDTRVTTFWFNPKTLVGSASVPNP